MPRYVILRHEMPAGCERASHWDFMLEADGALRTWALPAPPDSTSPIEAEALPDHRLAYLHIEGPISSAGGAGSRGTVARWDEGIYRLIRRSAGEWEIELTGKRSRGRATLTRLSQGETAAGAQRWRFSFSPEGAKATGLKPGSQVGEPSELPRVVRPAT
ncbi:MAG TPA: DNA polymerase ligase N-terminal domain-containing protein [Pirellulales bacterium]|nr:DNA polymerase ligase N-terminal domain-containing protein [Pirellulales bacterium]